MTPLSPKRTAPPHGRSLRERPAARPALAGLSRRARPTPVSSARGQAPGAAGTALGHAGATALRE
ncbi:hypothetical protein, partial [Thiococcus pfennigii]|uniref:hypothetical protein n=1 Tax=Thiococcus pfennigii TaxID=1057 RepID=UPI001A933B33